MDDQDRQVLNKLWRSDPKNEKKRIQNTKGDLLKDVYEWILSNPDFKRWLDGQEHRILWIRGDPGKGKTMLLCGIIDELQLSIGESKLLSFFFCQATDPRLNNATAVLRCLIRQLIDQQPSLISHLRKKADKYQDIWSWYDLLEIFTEFVEDERLKPTFLVIDGLDECGDGLTELFTMIMEHSSCPKIKWVVSSRNYASIHEQLSRAAQLSLELNAQSVSDAVEHYIQHKMRQLTQRKMWNSETQTIVRDHLTQNSGGTFLWVALVCEHLMKKSFLYPTTQMKLFPPGLDALYERMLQRVSESDGKDFCLRIIALAAMLYRPITLSELLHFVEVPEDARDHELDFLHHAIVLCGSFLVIREDTVYIVHQSAKEFLDKKAAQKEISSEAEEIHFHVFSKSMDAISEGLVRDVYGLRAPGYSIDQVRCPVPDPLATMQYACVYWVDHLIECYSRTEVYGNFNDGSSVETFFCKDYLHWLEALSLWRILPTGIASILKLRNYLEVRVVVIINNGFLLT
ncbi:hypothetical protein N7468_006440 [Penicillium chermesinum]|uniref:NACHT domain-containing protein n=1 Tax=Penicillium chermesinum TaxID=63820 RepID=A0A9W9TL54_9EURO|nr:uncharacterized protein N7468_006440 [Penicillium chermesinum]KAJ5225215.1 hypothetical protein N7468_006440 [Penicillium chermesinum]